ncbi:MULTISPECIES: hypothetical protein [Brevibacterium]
MDEVVKVVHQGFEAVQSDGSSRLEHFEVAASQMSRKIVVDVELQVPTESAREVEDDVDDLIHRALVHTGQFTWDSDNSPGLMHLTQGFSQYAYA